MMILQTTLQQFQDHYTQRLRTTHALHPQDQWEVNHQFQVQSDLLKPDNYPTIFHHGGPTDEVIVLTHGLSDSPYYMKAVGERFYQAGFNVIFPLLPAHGLLKPDKAFEDEQLDQKWRAELDAIVPIAQQLGKRVSLGGFSTGGALSYNYLLRHAGQLTGALFLFSGALAIPYLKGAASRSHFLQFLSKIQDGEIDGTGRDPYKYPDFPYFGVMELGQIIYENNDLTENKVKLSNPVFAAHSVHDESALLKGIVHVLENHCSIGTAYLICENVAHAELPLDRPIPLDHDKKEGPETAPQANPQFEMMMENVMDFIRRHLG